jgi:alanyl-tRNA synthetase
VELGDENNLWSMGETGPSGPCSEIYWDLGDKFAHKGCLGPGCECDRYIEIWNHVFTQFDKQADGTFMPLPRKNIDTGMGLERLVCMVENKFSAFETTLFYPVIEAASDLLKIKYNPEKETSSSFRIIADHVRASVFLISEGIIPSNEGRGYVLRRLIRRAERFGRMLGAKESFLYKLVQPVSGIFKNVYSQIANTENQIIQTLKFEEEGFLETLEIGEKYLKELLEKHHKIIPGAESFKLYETYGFPLELTREIAFKKGVKVDEKGFEKAKIEAQKIARDGWKDSGEREVIMFQKAENEFSKTTFVGYENTLSESRIIGLLDLKGINVLEIAKNLEGYVILDKTPFYAESGGQTGDRGSLHDKNGKMIAEVSDTQKPFEKIVLHKIKANEPVKKDAQVIAIVSTERQNTACNHTATHLVNAALRQVFGPSVRQAGSIVTPEKFRFDYTVTKTPSKDEIAKVEEITNEAIAENYRVFKMERPLKDAGAFGAITLLGEKYKDPARFILINHAGWENPGEKFSLELCGGTHIDELKELIVVKILKDSALSRGVRRIEGVAGPVALEYLKKITNMAETISARLSINPEELSDRIDKMIENERKLKAEIEKIKKKSVSQDYKNNTEIIKITENINLMLCKTEESEIPDLRSTADKFRNSQKESVLFLYFVKDEKISFIITHTHDFRSFHFNASAIAKEIATILNGSGGGRKDFAQGGGTAPADIDIEDFKKQLTKIIKKHI